MDFAMSIRYTHSITIKSSLDAYQEFAGEFIQSDEDMPIPVTLILQGYQDDGAVNKDSTVGATIYRRFDTTYNFIVTLYDNVGYIVGRTHTFDTRCFIDHPDKVSKLYRYNNTNRLSLGDIIQHIPDGLPSAVFHIGVMTCDNGVDALSQYIRGRDLTLPRFKSLKGLKCTAPTVTFQLVSVKRESVEIRSNEANKDNNAAAGDNHQVEIGTYEVQSLMNNSAYFMNCIPKTPNAEGGKVMVSITDVDPKLFRRFVDFVHYGIYVYLMTEDGLTLQKCCHEMLEIADRFLCPELATKCAKCIVQVTSKDTIFADIHFLATHYNGMDKMELISDTWRELRELQPENQLEQLYTLCQQLPDVAASLLYRLTISD